MKNWTIFNVAQCEISSLIFCVILSRSKPQDSGTMVFICPFLFLFNLWCVVSPRVQIPCPALRLKSRCQPTTSVQLVAVALQTV